MGDSVNRVLFVNSEIFPYLPESGISNIGRYLPQGIQERKREIRSFMPRYGCINERKNQLHEVIRLSGMNIIINDVDRPLIIKVASISAARMQVYFIDNEDYFHRKQVIRDENGDFFKDNGERAVFFARGVLETVKKLALDSAVVGKRCTFAFSIGEDPFFSELVIFSVGSKIVKLRVTFSREITAEKENALLFLNTVCRDFFANAQFVPIPK